MKVKILFTTKANRDLLVTQLGSDTARPFDDRVSLAPSYSATVDGVESISMSESECHLIVRNERCRANYRAWGAAHIEVTR